MMNTSCVCSSGSLWRLLFLRTLAPSFTEQGISGLLEIAAGILSESWMNYLEITGNLHSSGLKRLLAWTEDAPFRD
jgi:hypothetical protein